MTLDQFLTSLVYLSGVFLLFFIAKFAYDLTHRRFNLKKQLVEADNLAMAITMTGYFFGVVFAMSGVILGPSAGLWNDLFDLYFFGLIGIALLLISAKINDKIILRHFDNVKEIIEDQNAGTGAIEAGNHIAVGLMIGGALSGQNGDIWTALAFWGLGQLALIVIAIGYNFILPFDLHKEVEKDNVAVGVAFAGVLIALGNIVRLGVGGDFYSWSENLAQFGIYVGLCMVLLPVLRVITDVLLLPGAKLTDELVNQEKPNIGAGLIEASSYVVASLLITWAVH